MNLANIITAFRILLTPFFVYFLYMKSWTACFYILVLAGISDLFDGYVARKWNLRTTVGAYLDPAADKFLLLSSFVVLSINNVISAWFTIAIILRDIIVVTGSFFLARSLAGFKILPTRAGKLGTFFQVCLLVTLLVNRIFPSLRKISDILLPIFMSLAVVLTLISGYQYIRRGFREFARRTAT